MATSTESIISTTLKTSKRVALEPAHNAIASFFLIAWADEMPGVAKWVTDTAVRLTPPQRQRHRVLFEGVVHALYPERSWPHFTDYLNDLATQSPLALQERVFEAYELGHKMDNPPSRMALLADFDTFYRYLQQRFPKQTINALIEQEAHRLLNDPSQMQQLAVDHLDMMWHTYLAEEWQRNLPLLQASVDACNQLELAHLSNIEAARLITGHELDSGWYKLAEANEIAFIPSAHIGPYLNKMGGMVDGVRQLQILFGARIPEGTSVQMAALSRSELLVRLNALADDTRLRMLRLLADGVELCAPDIMQALDLSQSATSRHIRQLSATGYVNVRRREGAKCYTLNQERIEATWQALAQFLSQKSE